MIACFIYLLLIYWGIDGLFINKKIIGDLICLPINILSLLYLLFSGRKVRRRNMELLQQRQEIEEAINRRQEIETKRKEEILMLIRRREWERFQEGW